MRIGINPEKKTNQLQVDNYHRIVIPVYLPHFEGYFKDGFKIFKLCLESLLLTIHSKTRITIYNNNSHVLVKQYIDEKYLESESIDQVFHSKINLGKINAILASVKGNLEPLVTIADSDVFFKQNWQHEVEEIFNNFNYAGMVSPVPSSKAFNSFTNANWFYGVFKGKLKFEKVKNPKEMKMFENSLMLNYTLYDKIHLDKYLTIQSKKNKAVMGCGHFVATIRREVFDLGSDQPAFQKIQGNVENNFIDKPNEDLGFLRLATLNNYAFHMGNVVEDWMSEEFNLLKGNTIASTFNVNKEYKRLNKFQIFIGKFIGVLLNKRQIKRVVFKNIFKINPDY